MKYGYVFKKCKVTTADNVTKMYLGRPWRPYAYTLFMECELDEKICPEGWENWGKKSNEETARYFEYNNTGEGAYKKERAAWTRQLTKKEAAEITVENLFNAGYKWVLE